MQEKCEKCIELENENNFLKTQLEQLNKKYESLKMRLTDTHNQLARGTQDIFYK